MKRLVSNPCHVAVTFISCNTFIVPLMEKRMILYECDFVVCMMSIKV